MNAVDDTIARAKQRCETLGVRLTTKRKLILSLLVESDMALSAYEIMGRCRERTGENISAMSVYRVLQFLEEQKLVHKLSMANKYIACGHILCDHSHGVSQFLICEKCSKVKELYVKPDTIAELENDIAETGFKLLSPRLEIRCFCENCATS